MKFQNLLLPYCLTAYSHLLSALVLLDLPYIIDNITILKHQNLLILFQIVRKVQQKAWKKCKSIWNSHHGHPFLKADC